MSQDLLGKALGTVGEWPVDNVSAAVVGPDGAVALHGDDSRVYRLASVTKPIVATAALLAVEEEAISLDDPAGPEGSTVRHLLAHASGLDFADRDKVRTGRGSGASTLPPGSRCSPTTSPMPPGSRFPTTYMRPCVGPSAWTL